MKSAHSLVITHQIIQQRRKSKLRCRKFKASVFFAFAFEFKIEWCPFFLINISTGFCARLLRFGVFPIQPVTFSFVVNNLHLKITLQHLSRLTSINSNLSSREFFLFFKNHLWKHVHSSINTIRASSFACRYSCRRCWIPRTF